MGVITLFCSPGEKYRKKTENFVATEYARLNAEFDSFLAYNEVITPDINTPDLILDLGKKEDRDCSARIYARHSAMRIGSTDGAYFVTSYLINVASNEFVAPEKQLILPEKIWPKKRKILPDIDIVEVIDLDDANRGIDELISFYEKIFGWKTFRSDEQFPRNTEVGMNGKTDYIPDAVALMIHAQKNLGYNFKKTCL